MWAAAQRDGRLAQYRWRPLLNAAVWLTPTARVPCSNAADIGERKIWTQSEFCTCRNSVREQDPPLTYTQCTSGGDGWTLCKVSLASGERRRCSNDAKTWILLKFAGVPKHLLVFPKLTNPSQPLVGWSSRYCEDMWWRYCCLTSFSDCWCMP